MLYRRAKLLNQLIEPGGEGSNAIALALPKISAPLLYFYYLFICIYMCFLG
jgi:hypothetical protein